MIALLVVALAVTVAALVQGAIGVGFALIVAPVAAIVRPDLLPGSILVLMLPLNAYVAWRERAYFDLPSASWITIGRLAGTFAGLWILIVVTRPALNMVVGCTTIFAAIATIFAPRFAPNKTAYIGAGLITGVTETATGIGGPPLALVYQHHPAPTLRSTIALCFLVGELFSLLVLFVQGRIGLPQLSDAALLLLPLVLGLLASSWVHSRLSGELLRDALLIFAVISGLVLIVQSAAL
jgi:uncharacterized protein